jgi:hypothetical protein
MRPFHAALAASYLSWHLGPHITHEREPGEDEDPFEPTSEDAIATPNQFILEARQLLGTADKCEKCETRSGALDEIT